MISDFDRLRMMILDDLKETMDGDWYEGYDEALHQVLKWIREIELD